MVVQNVKRSENISSYFYLNYLRSLSGAKQLKSLQINSFVYVAIFLGFGIIFLNYVKNLDLRLYSERKSDKITGMAMPSDR